MASCTDCNKEFSSESNYYVHLREKHTHYNTKTTECNCCLNEFRSVKFNKDKDKSYSKCEECRDLQKTLATNDLQDGNFVYGKQDKRYKIDRGVAIEICKIYNCGNSIDCLEHSQDNFTSCQGSKCKNCFVPNTFNFCPECRKKDDKSKNKLRNSVKDLKVRLGGKCVDCGFSDLFLLEFDHIDPTLKIKQITRCKPSDWEQELANIELRCGRCHRMKSEITVSKESKSKNVKCKIDKQQFVSLIKQTIGKCQMCNWTCENKDKMCRALDFDHVSNDKYKQISDLYLNSKCTIATEIRKTRLICRHCHELHTCIQRGGKALVFYYTKEEIDDFTKKLLCKESQKIHLQELAKILDALGYTEET
jgi:hypothetical protein